MKTCINWSCCCTVNRLSPKRLWLRNLRTLCGAREEEAVLSVERRAALLRGTNPPGGREPLRELTAGICYTFVGNWGSGGGALAT